MKYFILISRLLVGSLFIISGLIKCNDSIGFSYKLNDYFAEGVLNLEFLIPYSLGLAAMICVVEIVLGVALIFGLIPKITTSLVLLMMLFFTWLTWYTSNCLTEMEMATKAGEDFFKECVTDCGCFGDAIPLEPYESFLKDLVLLIFTIPLFFASIFNKIKTNTSAQDLWYSGFSIGLLMIFNIIFIQWWFSLLFVAVLLGLVYLLKNKIQKQWSALAGAYILCLLFTYYCLEHLPVKDFRAYKIGDNLSQNMTLGPDAEKGLTEYTWTYSLNGKEMTYVDEGRGPKTYDKIIAVDTEVVVEPDEPKITDFSIESQEEDLTEAFLSKEKLVILTLYNINKSNKKGIEKLKTLSETARKKGYEVIGLTASGEDDVKALKKYQNLNFNFYYGDEKVIKTMVRSNPGLIILDKATVLDKAHWNDFENTKF